MWLHVVARTPFCEKGWYPYPNGRVLLLSTENAYQIYSNDRESAWEQVLISVPTATPTRSYLFNIDWKRNKMFVWRSAGRLCVNYRRMGCLCEGQIEFSHVLKDPADGLSITNIFENIVNYLKACYWHLLELVDIIKDSLNPTCGRALLWWCRISFFFGNWFISVRIKQSFIRKYKRRRRHTIRFYVNDKELDSFSKKLK